MIVNRRYKAFVSYSAVDVVLGRKLFRKLDGYRPPKSLRGRPTRFGPVPNRLYPIFRDRDELSTSGDLSKTITDALAASDHLIVICSPHAATSQWVNKEIRLFSQLDKADCIHVVLASGEPNFDGISGAFPSALRDVGIKEPLAVDLRSGGDGWTNGSLKIIARILGVDFADLRDREAFRARRRTGLAFGLAAMFAILSIFASTASFIAFDRSKRMQTTLLAILNQVRGRVNTVITDTNHGRLSTQSAERELSYAKALSNTAFELAPKNRLLLEEQGHLLLTYSKYYESVGQSANAEEASTAAGKIFEHLGSGDESNVDIDRMQAAALVEKGDALIDIDDRAGALKAYKDALVIARRRADDDPENARKAHDLSLSLGRIGDIQSMAGNHGPAIEVFQESAEILWRLAEEDPGNGRLVLDLSASLSKIGDLQISLGEHADALAVYEFSLQLTRVPAEFDPSNADWRRRLFAMLTKVGDARLALGDHGGASKAYNESLGIIQRLVDHDPGNMRWKDDLSACLARIGGVILASGDAMRALEYYDNALAIQRQLSAAQPRFAEWTGDVSMILRNVAEARNAMGEYDGALEAYEESHTIAKQLEFRHPGNVRWMHNSYMALYGLGRFYESTDRPALANVAYQSALQISVQLEAANPENSLWERDNQMLRTRIQATVDE